MRARELTSEARSFLFVPGSRPDRVTRAADSGADLMIIDLEDSVADGDKDMARSAARDYVASAPALVRINCARSRWHRQDLAALRGSAALVGVVLPKAEKVEEIASVRRSLDDGVVILALIETARGLRDASALAQAHGVTRLLLGHLDLCLDLGIPSPGNRDALAYARGVLVTASRAAGLPGPVDGVQPRIDSPDLMLSDAIYAAGLGFGGKLCIHPSQISAVHEAFRPATTAVQWAALVLQVAGTDTSGAVQVCGEMIDRPQVELARRILARADEKR
jgi:citrate lyase beta subunit